VRQDFRFREFSTGQAVTVLSISDRRSGSASHGSRRAPLRAGRDKVSAASGEPRPCGNVVGIAKTVLYK
jgi:hypothetical protein